MSATATRESAYFASAKSEFSFHGHNVARHGDGTATVEGVQVFRTGTFRDSMGEQFTWEMIHLQQMVAHFELLGAAGIGFEAPVRRDHSFSIEKVMGYMENVRLDGEFLVADFRITEPDQVDKVVRGTYRFVSLEVGMYVTNDEAAYWPTVFGVAYVDIPAVEGLHDKDRTVRCYSSRNITDSGEDPMPGTQNDDRGASRPDAPAPSTFRVNGSETTDHAAVQAHITELEARPGPATFRVAGAEVTDSAAVQSHIDSLEAFQTSTRESARNDFVQALAEDDKIVATQVEPLQKLVAGFTQEQYDEWAATYKDAPKLGLLANHGKGANEDGNSPAGESTTDEKVILEAQVQMHRDAGMNPEEVKNTTAYQRLTEINSQQGAA